MFSVAVRNLKKALTHAGKAVDAKASSEILHHVLLTASHETGLTVTGNNLETQLSWSEPASVSEPGELMMPYKLTKRLIDALPQDGIILVSATDERVELQCGTTTLRLPIKHQPDVFPRLTRKTFDPFAVVESDWLKQQLGRMLPFVAHEDNRPVLLGVNFMPQNDRLTMLSSDGFRAVMLDVPAANMTARTPSIISAHSLDILCALMHGKVAIEMGEWGQTMWVVGENFTLVAQVIEGKYPDVQSLFPQHAFHTITAREALLTSVKRAMLIAVNDHDAVRLHIEGDSITVAANAENQTIEDTVPAIFGLMDSSVDATLNGAYLLDGLKAIEGSKVWLMGNRTTPWLLKGEASDFVYCQMPMSRK